jgi:HEAT repeat protein
VLAALGETISTVDSGNHDLEAIIEKLLSSDNLQYRIAGIQAIGRIPSLSDAEFALLKRARTNDPSPAIRFMAEAALGKTSK